MGTALAGTFTNLARALNQGRRCLLLARPETAEKIRALIADDPPLMRDTGEARIYRAYNKNRPLRVVPDDERVYQPAGGENTWLYNGRVDRYELYGADPDARITVGVIERALSAI